ncbi:inter-alpha-trypsin inhibitor heavy chain H3-like [Megalobrama amblycephala]|uniref:inter-alpha-trypsin inhibitor heavy chain H3-like n=1 Tax=Megalobrama amblycephala TaxID=75352 RepID=UPI0020147CB0|nr:inter-alpha-trypsin inhibitor heavy chain H3-like [Megalobrama amblycephala]
MDRAALRLILLSVFLISASSQPVKKVRVKSQIKMKMTYANGGVARRIYEDSDADLQLQGFYDEVADPLLTDIQLKYTGGTNLTKTSFNLYFNGSEIVVSGQITDNSVESFSTEVIAVSKGNNVTYQDTVMIKDPSDVPPENEDFMQRLWAYLTVKQLLERQ